MLINVPVGKVAILLQAPMGTFFIIKDSAMKRCNKCSGTNVAQRKGRKLSYYCKDCKKKYYEENKPKILEQFKENYLNHKDERKEYARNYRDENIDQVLEKDRKYSRDNRAKLNIKRKERELAHPEKLRAKQLIKNAVNRGDLPRVSTLTCKECGKQAVERHHPDYSKPMETIPLCYKHHGETKRT